MHTNTTGRDTDRKSHVEYRIVNVVGHGIFSERHLTRESAQARLDEFKEYGIDTKNLEIFICASPEKQWLRDPAQECQQ